MAVKLNLDKLDLQIIHEMMENAEISYAELGKKLFVSGGTIHVRIKKLQELAVVKGTKLHVDLKQLGYDVIAFIGIYLEKSSLYDSVARELHKIPRSSGSTIPPATTACLQRSFVKTSISCVSSCTTNCRR
jgi:Lrp/AsnC family transcriptional regulator for asnA, asnC and gidA